MILYDVIGLEVMLSSVLMKGIISYTLEDCNSACYSCRSTDSPT